MANVYFPKPSRYEVFAMMYVQHQQARHHDNLHWQTFQQAYENLGGLGCIHNVWDAFNWVSAEAQKRICGFTNGDITAFLERDDAGREYAIVTRQ